MSTPVRLRGLLPAVLAALILFPSPAAAQWYLAYYVGGTHTQNSDVSIRMPSANLALDFQDVHFYSESLQSRIYYGVRLGRIGWRERRIGLELELIHMKAIGDTTRDYVVTAAPGNVFPPTGAVPMDLLVQEYRMTHGLNLALVNLVLRRPLGGTGSGPVALMIRAGAGPTFPHAETIVNNGVVHHYEYAGFAGQGAAGLEVRLPYRLLALAEYKLTYARPNIEVTQGGTSSMTALSHHISVGFGFALTR